MIAGLIGLLLGCSNPASPYTEKGGAWFYKKQPMDVPKGESLTNLNNYFARSKTGVWYLGTRIEDADPETFKPISDRYAVDAKTAWYGETYRDSSDYFTTQRVRLRQLEGVDPTHLKVLEFNHATDGRTLFYEGQRTAVADPATFQALPDGFSRDKVQGYYWHTPIPGSHGQGFEQISNAFAKDAKSVFYAGPGLDPGDFRIATVKGADPMTFKALPYDYATDKAAIYYEDKLLKGEPGDFQVLDFGYAKASGTIFHYGEPMSGADAATFAILETVTDQASAKDKTGFYKDGKRVAGP